MVWSGELNLTSEAYLLQQVARKIDENLFVVENRNAQYPGRSKALIREAVWWSARGDYEKDKFIGIRFYDSCYPANRRPRKPQGAAGKNCASNIHLLSENPEGGGSLLYHSSSDKTAVRPLFIQKTALYDLIWFTHGAAILQQDFEMVRGFFGDVKYFSNAKGSLFAYENSQLVAVLEPSPVPNRETVELARHEIALRMLPRSQEGMIELVKNHFRLYRGEEARSSWCAVDRLISAFWRYHDYSYGWSLRGLTAWYFCPQIARVDDSNVFKGTEIPVSCLFLALLRKYGLPVPG